MNTFDSIKEILSVLNNNDYKGKREFIDANRDIINKIPILEDEKKYAEQQLKKLVPNLRSLPLLLNKSLLYKDKQEERNLISYVYNLRNELNICNTIKEMENSLEMERINMKLMDPHDSKYYLKNILTSISIKEQNKLPPALVKEFLYDYAEKNDITGKVKEYKEEIFKLNLEITTLLEKTTNKFNETTTTKGQLEIFRNGQISAGVSSIPGILEKITSVVTRLACNLLKPNSDLREKIRESYLSKNIHTSCSKITELNSLRFNYMKRVADVVDKNLPDFIVHIKNNKKITTTDEFVGDREKEIKEQHSTSAVENNTDISQNKRKSSLKL